MLINKHLSGNRTPAYKYYINMPVDRLLFLSRDQTKTCKQFTQNKKQPKSFNSTYYHQIKVWVRIEGILAVCSCPHSARSQLFRYELARRNHQRPCVWRRRILRLSRSHVPWPLRQGRRLEKQDRGLLIWNFWKLVLMLSGKNVIKWLEGRSRVSL